MFFGANGTEGPSSVHDETMKQTAMDTDSSLTREAVDTSQQQQERRKRGRPPKIPRTDTVSATSSATRPAARKLQISEDSSLRSRSDSDNDSDLGLYSPDRSESARKRKRTLSMDSHKLITTLSQLQTRRSIRGRHVDVTRELVVLFPEDDVRSLLDIRSDLEWEEWRAVVSEDTSGDWSDSETHSHTQHSASHTHTRSHSICTTPRNQSASDLTRLGAESVLVPTVREITSIESIVQQKLQQQPPQPPFSSTTDRPEADVGDRSAPAGRGRKGQGRQSQSSAQSALHSAAQTATKTPPDYEEISFYSYELDEEDEDIAQAMYLSYIVPYLPVENSKGRLVATLQRAPSTPAYAESSFYDLFARMLSRLERDFQLRYVTQNASLHHCATALFRLQSLQSLCKRQSDASADFVHFQRRHPRPVDDDEGDNEQEASKGEEKGSEKQTEEKETEEEDHDKDSESTSERSLRKRRQDLLDRILSVSLAPLPLTSSSLSALEQEQQHQQQQQQSGHHLQSAAQTAAHMNNADRDKDDTVSEAFKALPLLSIQELIEALGGEKTATEMLSALILQESALSILLPEIADEMAQLVLYHWAKLRAHRKQSLLRAYHVFIMPLWALPPKTALVSAQDYDIPNLQLAYRQLQHIRRDLDRARLIVDRVRRREKLKREVTRTAGEFVTSHVLGEELLQQLQSHQHRNQQSLSTALFPTLSGSNSWNGQTPRRRGRPRRSDSIVSISGEISALHMTSAAMGVERDPAGGSTPRRLYPVSVSGVSSATPTAAAGIAGAGAGGSGDVPLPPMRDRFGKFMKRPAPPKDSHSHSSRTQSSSNTSHNNSNTSLTAAAQTVQTPTMTLALPQSLERMSMDVVIEDNTEEDNEEEGEGEESSGGSKAPVTTGVAISPRTPSMPTTTSHVLVPTTPSAAMMTEQSLLTTAQLLPADFALPAFSRRDILSFSLLDDTEEAESSEAAADWLTSADYAQRLLQHFLSTADSHTAQSQSKPRSRSVSMDVSAEGTTIRHYSPHNRVTADGDDDESRVMDTDADPDEEQEGEDEHDREAVSVTSQRTASTHRQSGGMMADTDDTGAEDYEEEEETERSKNEEDSDEEEEDEDEEDDDSEYDEDDDDEEEGRPMMRRSSSRHKQRPESVRRSARAVRAQQPRRHSPRHTHSSGSRSSQQVPETPPPMSTRRQQEAQSLSSARRSVPTCSLQSLATTGSSSSAENKKKTPPLRTSPRALQSKK